MAGPTSCWGLRDRLYTWPFVVHDHDDDAICNLKFNVRTSLFNVPSQVGNADTSFLCQGVYLAFCSHYVVTIPVLLSTSKMNLAVSTVCLVYQL